MPEQIAQSPWIYVRVARQLPLGPAHGLSLGPEPGRTNLYFHTSDVMTALSVCQSRNTIGDDLGPP